MTVEDLFYSIMFLIHLLQEGTMDEDDFQETLWNLLDSFLEEQ